MRAIAGNLGTSFFAPTGTVWLSWILTPQQIWCVSGSWELIICPWGNRGCRGYRRIRARISTFGDGRPGDVRIAAKITRREAGCAGTVAAFVLEADIPALLRKGALEAPVGNLDFSCDVLTLRKQGVGLPLEVNPIRPYVPEIGPPKLGGGAKVGGFVLCEKTPWCIQCRFAFTTR